MSTVDIIIPCYRYGHFLKECVESVLAQSGILLRVLIIDDASPDNTAEVATELAKRDSRVTFFRHSSNRGHIATYNEGIDWVAADYLLLLSADDYLLGGALQRAASFMDRHPEVGFVFGNVIERDDQCADRTTNAVSCSQRERILAGAEFIELSGAHNIVPTPTAVIRTGLQKIVGGYRPELPCTGDMEMWLRLAAHASVGFVRTPQAVYRRHSNNMTLYYTQRNWWRDFEQRREALNFFFRTCKHALENSEKLRKDTFYDLASEAVGMASTAFNEGDMETCSRLAEFARELSPRVARSVPWTKLRCKRSVGLRVWRMVRPRLPESSRLQE